MKYFYDKKGQYLGCTNDGSNITDFHGIADEKPEHGGMVWDNVNSQWEDSALDSESEDGSGAVQSADGGESGE